MIETLFCAIARSSAIISDATASLDQSIRSTGVVRRACGNVTSALFPT